MILKNKLIFLTLSIVLLLSTNSFGAKQRGVYATKNIQGQNYYLKRCSECHGEGSRGGNMASIKEWEVIFSKKAHELIYLHEEDEESKGLVAYIKSKEFEKESSIMLQFLQEFAYDSENIPTCN